MAEHSTKIDLSDNMGNDETNNLQNEDIQIESDSAAVEINEKSVSFEAENLHNRDKLLETMSNSSIDDERERIFPLTSGNSTLSQKKIILDQTPRVQRYEFPVLADDFYSFAKSLTDPLACNVNNDAVLLWNDVLIRHADDFNEMTNIGVDMSIEDAFKELQEIAINSLESKGKVIEHNDINIDEVDRRNEIVDDINGTTNDKNKEIGIVNKSVVKSNGTQSSIVYNISNPVVCRRRQFEKGEELSKERVICGSEREEIRQLTNFSSSLFQQNILAADFRDRYRGSFLRDHCQNCLEQIGMLNAYSNYISSNGENISRSCGHVCQYSNNGVNSLPQIDYSENPDFNDSVIKNKSSMENNLTVISQPDRSTNHFNSSLTTDKKCVNGFEDIKSPHLNNQSQLDSGHFEDFSYDMTLSPSNSARMNDIELLKNDTHRQTFGDNLIEEKQQVGLSKDESKSSFTLNDFSFNNNVLNLTDGDSDVFVEDECYEPSHDECNNPEPFNLQKMNETQCLDSGRGVNSLMRKMKLKGKMAKKCHICFESKIPKDRQSQARKILVRCMNSSCQKTLTLSEARKSYKNCHHCLKTYYCCRECRRQDWARHKADDNCHGSRINSQCKKVIEFCNTDAEVKAVLSRLAFRGYLAHGRGCIMIGFPNLESAALFVEHGFSMLKLNPIYISVKELKESKMYGDFKMLDRLLETCQNYKPDVKFVINVGIGMKVESNHESTKRVIEKQHHCHQYSYHSHNHDQLDRFGSQGSDLGYGSFSSNFNLSHSPKALPSDQNIHRCNHCFSFDNKLQRSPSSRHKAPILQKFLKLRLTNLSDLRKECEKILTMEDHFWDKLRTSGQTLILTSVPEQSDLALTDEERKRKKRELTFTNIQRKLRERHVNLRIQYPSVHNSLIEFVTNGVHFPSQVLFPVDGKTKKSFTCFMMPEAEYEFEWMQTHMLLNDLGLSRECFDKSLPQSLCSSMPSLPICHPSQQKALKCTSPALSNFKPRSVSLSKLDIEEVMDKPKVNGQHYNALLNQRYHVLPCTVTQNSDSSLTDLEAIVDLKLHESDLKLTVNDLEDNAQTVNVNEDTNSFLSEVSKDHLSANTKDARVNHVSELNENNIPSKDFEEAKNISTSQNEVSFKQHEDWKTGEKISNDKSLNTNNENDHPKSNNRNITADPSLVSPIYIEINDQKMDTPLIGSESVRHAPEGNDSPDEFVMPNTITAKQSSPSFYPVRKAKNVKLVSNYQSHSSPTTKHGKHPPKIKDAIINDKINSFRWHARHENQFAEFPLKSPTSPLNHEESPALYTSTPKEKYAKLPLFDHLSPNFVSISTTPKPLTELNSYKEANKKTNSPFQRRKVTNKNAENCNKTNGFDSVHRSKVIVDEVDQMKRKRRGRGDGYQGSFLFKDDNEYSRFENTPLASPPLATSTLNRKQYDLYNGSDFEPSRIHSEHHNHIINPRLPPKNSENQKHFEIANKNVNNPSVCTSNARKNDMGVYVKLKSDSNCLNAIHHQKTDNTETQASNQTLCQCHHRHCFYRESHAIYTSCCDNVRNELNRRLQQSSDNHTLYDHLSSISQYYIDAGNLQINRINSWNLTHQNSHLNNSSQISMTPQNRNTQNGAHRINQTKDADNNAISLPKNIQLINESIEDNTAYFNKDNEHHKTIGYEHHITIPKHGARKNLSLNQKIINEKCNDRNSTPKSRPKSKIKSKDRKIRFILPSGNGQENTNADENHNSYRADLYDSEESILNDGSEGSHNLLPPDYVTAVNRKIAVNKPILTSHQNSNDRMESHYLVPSSMLENINYNNISYSSDW